MARKWSVSFGETERMELEAIMLDEDADGALDFLERVVYPAVKDSEKPGGCYYDVSKEVDEVSRPISWHKRLGRFD